jgi:hypothetical protein
MSVPSQFTERLQTYTTPDLGDRLRGLVAVTRKSQAQIVSEALELLLPSRDELAARMQQASPESTEATA